MKKEQMKWINVKTDLTGDMIQKYPLNVHKKAEEQKFV